MDCLRYSGNSRAMCGACGQVMVSKSAHDYQTCGCGKSFVDGGRSYFRGGGYAVPLRIRLCSNYGISPEGLDYLRKAWHVAMRSKDPSTQIGAVLVSRRNSKGKRQVVEAVNRIPGRAICGEDGPDIRWQDRDKKYKAVVHAETAVLLEAARVGVPTEGSVMYCNFACCRACANGIIAAGVTTVVASAEPLERCPERWRDSVQEGIDHLLVNGVHYIAVRSKFDKPRVLLDGKVWSDG